MTSSFAEDTQSVVGPVLADLGFTLDEIDDRPDPARGGSRHIVYYRSKDCKIQVYESSREGEVNCMIAPLDAPNEFGLRSEKWQFLARFGTRPDSPLEELARLAKAEYESFAKPLEWVKDRIEKYFEDAHAGILEMYKDP